MTEPVRVGVVGLGRSGYNIHLKAIRTLPEQYRVVAVADGDEKRCADTAAEFPGCKAYPNPESLFADPDVDLAVVATPSFLHTQNTVAALKAGKDVVCEKPFGLSVADVDTMIAASDSASQTAERTVSVWPFQNLRFDESFGVVRAVLESGVLGDILQIRLATHSFSRRWDWQTLRAYGGGQLNNMGTHLLDLAMVFLAIGGITDENDLDLLSDLRQALASGDAEDHVRLTLRSRSNPKGPLVDIETTAACAYPQDRYFIMGTLGGLHGTGSRVEWKWLDPADLAERTVDAAPTADRGYLREELNWHQDAKDCDASSEGFNKRYYEALYKTIREDALFPVTATDVRKRMSLIQRAREQAEA